ncbi:MAG: hypothetical protein WDZ74_02410 [Candidatus Paceibacterota bacterium]
MVKYALLLIAFTSISVGFTQEYLSCLPQNEQSVHFQDLTDPIIGFTETVLLYGAVYSGWYIVELDFAPLLPFKAFFLSDTYVDGLEIGKRFETPRKLWMEKGFMDYQNMLRAYEDLKAHAPICTN